MDRSNTFELRNSLSRRNVCLSLLGAPVLGSCQTFAPSASLGGSGTKWLLYYPTSLPPESAALGYMLSGDGMRYFRAREVAVPLPTPSSGLVTEPFIIRDVQRKIYHLLYVIGSGSLIGVCRSNDLLTWSAPIVMPIRPAAGKTVLLQSPAAVYNSRKDEFLIWWIEIEVQNQTAAAPIGQAAQGTCRFATTRDFEHFSEPGDYFGQRLDVRRIVPVDLKSGLKLVAFLGDRQISPNGAAWVEIGVGGEPLLPLKSLSIPPFTGMPLFTTVTDQAVVFFTDEHDGVVHVAMTTDWIEWHAEDEKLNFVPPPGASVTTLFAARARNL